MFWPESQAATDMPVLAIARVLARTWTHVHKVGRKSTRSGALKSRRVHQGVRFLHRLEYIGERICDQDARSDRRIILSGDVR